jgi:DNA-binding MarR family transcriptional regulator
MRKPKTARASGGVRRDSAIEEAIQVLQRLAEVFARRRQQLARGAGLSDGQWRVLEQIAREDFMPSLFARGRESHPAAVSRQLRQLIDLGLIEAAISASDGRQRDYSLSARGRRVLEQLRAAREQAIDAVWSQLPDAEVARFARFGAQLADQLERYAAGADESDGA